MQAHESKYFRHPFWEVVSNTVTQLLQKKVGVAWSDSCYTLTANHAVGNGLQTGTYIRYPELTSNGDRTAVHHNIERNSKTATAVHYLGTIKRNYTKMTNALPAKPNPAVSSSTLPVFFLFGKPLVQISVSILHCLVLVRWGLEASYCCCIYSRLVNETKQYPPTRVAFRVGPVSQFR